MDSLTSTATKATTGAKLLIATFAMFGTGAVALATVPLGQNFNFNRNQVGSSLIKQVSYLKEIGGDEINATNAIVLDFENPSLKTESAFWDKYGLKITSGAYYGSIKYSYHEVGSSEFTASGRYSVFNETGTQDSINQPMILVFKDGVNKVGFYLGNGYPKLTASVTAYGYNNVKLGTITRTGVNDSVNSFMALSSSELIYKLEIDYGPTATTEEIDNLMFIKNGVKQLQLNEINIDNPIVLDFEDTTKNLSTDYWDEFDVRIDSGLPTGKVSYAGATQMGGEKTWSGKYSIFNHTSPKSSIDIPLVITFKEGVRKVGFAAGSGSPGLYVTVSAYGLNENFLGFIKVPLTTKPVTNYIGLTANEKIYKVVLDYGPTAATESIDSLMYTKK